MTRPETPLPLDLLAFIRPIPRKKESAMAKSMLYGQDNATALVRPYAYNN